MKCEMLCGMAVCEYSRALVFNTSTGCIVKDVQINFLLPLWKFGNLFINVQDFNP